MLQAFIAASRPPRVPLRRAELYTPYPQFPGNSEQEQAAWADAHARAFFVSSFQGKEPRNSSYTKTAAQFDEIFGGWEGDPAVQHNFMRVPAMR